MHKCQVLTISSSSIQECCKMRFLVAVLLLGVAVVESALPPRSDRDHNNTSLKGQGVSLQDVLQGTFAHTGFRGVWIPGSENKIRVSSPQTVWEYDVESGENTTVLDKSVLMSRFGNTYFYVTVSLSPDGKYVLIGHNVTTLWRHSFLAKYDVYSLEERTWSTIQPQDAEMKEQDQVLLQLVQWAPTGHSLAFIYRNNIYYKKEHGVGDMAVQLTNDGSDAVFNGISDWVYEEEMFSSPVALWFSTDSSNLAYVKFNDSAVEFYQWPLYGEPGMRESAYPIYDPIRYPKAGWPNPAVSLHVVDLLNEPTLSTSKQIVYPPEVDEKAQYYIGSVVWASSTFLLIQNLNRHQNVSTWSFCNAKDAICTKVYQYAQTKPKGWIDIHTPWEETIKVSKDVSHFLTLEPVAQTSNGSSGRYFMHIVSVPITTSADNANNVRGFQSTPVTSGNFHVDSILGWDETNEIIYFQGSGRTTEGDGEPSENHIYSVSTSKQEASRTILCLSCDIKTTVDEVCRAHSFTFSDNYKYYLHSCKGPGVPEVSTRRTNDSHVVRMWNDNARLRTKLENVLLPTTKDMVVEVEGGFKARVRLYLPPNLDMKKKYPLVIEVYAGPNSKKVDQNFQINWGTYLASSKGIIYGNIDARGSGRQSLDMMYSVYRNLGTPEVNDQIAVTKHLVETLPFIDANKTAIWGWSYGGYVTAMALGKDEENVFKCGISVAPVTSWLYYDTIYTERYMGLPTEEDNWATYYSSSVMNHTNNLRNKQYLLIHGTSDDNVHYQHSMMLARALEERDILFYQVSYPDESHAINGRGMKRHLYHSIERFLSQDCFGKNYNGEKNDSSPIFRANNPIAFFISVFVIALTNLLTP